MTLPSPPDHGCWLEALSGDEAAFAVLFDRHRIKVFRKAYARMQNVADAEDVVATVFLEAWDKRRTVHVVDGSILPWLLTAASYVMLNFERSLRRHRSFLASLPPPEPVPDHANAVIQEMEVQARIAQVNQAMTTLSRQEQTIIDLCLTEERTLSDVSDLLELPIGTVKSRLHRAREKLRHRMPDLQ